MVSVTNMSRNVDSGENRILGAFRQARLTKSAAVMPYFTLGYPDLDQSLDIVKAIAPHADLLELGVPFSDPIADGPTIQRSTQVALERGASASWCLRSVGELRKAGIDIPILLMGYYNPILAYGETEFVRDSANAGADGFIVPDLPPEESGQLRESADRFGLVTVYFLAPTSNRPRTKMVAAGAKGFIYLVSVTGVTGARSSLSQDHSEMIERIRMQSDVPVGVGFGISTPDQAAEVGRYADGIIVGSALIDAVDRSPDKPAAAASFVRSLELALSLE
ncbi:MAG: tryptophan synthase subunit alpha [Chloroflexota bacterium]|nr:MAG: tryptophan synthase subunit alpha [Chloroflexota bacterium]